MDLVFVLAFVQLAYSLDTDNQIPVNACEVGDVVENGRVTCTCTQKYAYVCVARTLTSVIEQDFRTKRELKCQPKKMYVHETTTCICNQNGTWPHRACGEIFDSLPTEILTRTKCEPGEYVFLDCNVCRCNSKGNVENDRCTKNKCNDEKSPERRSNNPGNVYGSCEAKNWYSLAPCQFCYCINENKLVCNTGNRIDKKLELGTYNLSVCGKDLIKEAIELIPKDENSLRHGETVVSAQSDQKATTSSTTLRAPFIPVDTARHEEVNKEIEIDKTDSESDSDTDKSVEEKVDMLRELRPVQSTQIPLQEDYSAYSRESTEAVDEKNRKDDNAQAENSDNEIEHSERNPEPGLRIPESSTSPVTPPTNKVSPNNRYLEMGRQLTQHLPYVLKNVLKMATLGQSNRKTMVTIDSKSECTPGTVQVVKCNTCYCLKNSKMLCTQVKCD